MFDPDDSLLIDDIIIADNFAAASGVPEPAALVLWSILGTAGIAAWRRNRKAAAA